MLFSAGPTRRFGVTFAASVMSLTLAGCAGSAADPAKPTVSKTDTATPSVSAVTTPTSGRVPKVGDCWNNTPTLVYKFAWDGGEPVPCSEKHNAVTYHVGTLPRGLDYVRTTAYTLSTVKVVTQVCGEATADAYLGHGDFNPPLRVLHSEYAPTEQQWAAGVRWFRCDLGFSENYTGLDARRHWLPLPADLRAEVERDDMPYRYCSNGTLRGGPNSKGSVTGRCGSGPLWLNTKAVLIAKSPHEAYPGFDAMRQRSNKACSVSGEWSTTWAGPTEWLNDAEGAKRAWCWVRRSGPA